MIRTIPCVCIEYSNKELVKWWNNIGGRLVRAHQIDTIVETATGKTVGVIVAVRGILAKYVVKKVNSFYESTTEMVL